MLRGDHDYCRNYSYRDAAKHGFRAGGDALMLLLFIYCLEISHQNFQHWIYKLTLNAKMMRPLSWGLEPQKLGSSL